MKFVGLISGGKDSIFNLLKCVAYGHELVCVANLHPPAQAPSQELDSFMFQTVGVEIVDAIAECLDVPLIKCEIQGKSINQAMYYEHNTGDQDEVEDLYRLLKQVKDTYPEVQGVASGAIFSNYQRLRVENVCQRLGLISLAYLWLKDQSELLQEMIDCQMDARIVKVCSMGLKPIHLGKSISQLQEYFHKLRDQFQFNVCGEGGEYESAVFDCPLYRCKRIEISECETVHHVDNDIAPVAYLKLTKLAVVAKSEEEIQSSRGVIEGLREGCRFKGAELEGDRVEWVQKEMGVIELPVSGVGVEGLKMIDHGEYVQTKHLSVLDFGKDSKDFSSDAEELSFIFKSLLEQGLNLAHSALQVNLLISDMSQFATLNDVYKSFFGLKPPVRACVAIPRNEVRVRVQVLFSNSSERKNLHVQSVSGWAPSNIGPYSQANQVGEKLMLSGQIGLEPSHMVLRGTFGEQIEGIMGNFNAVIAQIAGERFTVKNTTLYGLVYLSRQTAFDAERQAIVHEHLKGIPLIFLRVETLPRSALIEVELISSTSPPSLDAIATQLHLNSGTSLRILNAVPLNEETPKILQDQLKSVGDNFNITVYYPIGRFSHNFEGWFLKQIGSRKCAVGFVPTLQSWGDWMKGEDQFVWVATKY